MYGLQRNDINCLKYIYFFAKVVFCEEIDIPLFLGILIKKIH